MGLHQESDSNITSESIKKPISFLDQIKNAKKANLGSGEGPIGFLEAIKARKQIET